MFHVEHHFYEGNLWNRSPRGHAENGNDEDGNFNAKTFLGYKPDPKTLTTSLAFPLRSLR
jgi:hypothetical protein